MDMQDLVGQDWPYVLSLMPPDLEESAATKLALRRRREIESAGDLLRLALAYGLGDFSLRQAAAWAQLQGLGRLSDVAVLKRLRQAADWLGHLVVRWLQERGLTTAVPALSVRVVDATVICEPGSRGTDWRVHLGFDLAHQCLTTVEVTGPEGGESFHRQPVSPGVVLLGDRGYAQRGGVAGVLERQGHVLVRLNWQNLPLETPAGTALDLVSWLETLRPGELGDWPVQFREQERVYPMRLIGVRKSTAAAEREQQQIQHAARRKGRRPDARSLRAAHFLYVLTDLPGAVLPAAEALELYRLRWQIEIAFKRLKGLLHLDQLRAKGKALARTYLYAKLLGALLLDELCRQAEAFSPWGYRLEPAAPEPLAPAVAAAR